MKPGKDYTGVSVVFYCHDGSGNFLLHRRSKNCRNQQGMWDVGAGGLEFCEDPKETLARELKEEYAVTEFTISQQLEPISVIHSEGEEHWLAIPFIVQIDPAHVRIAEPEMIDEMAWFPVGEWPKPLHVGVALELKRFADVFNTYKV